MSVAVSSAVWKYSQAAGVPRLLLLAMADEAADNGDLIAYRRSRSHFAAKCNASPEAIRKAVKKLVESGELKVLREGTGRASSDYRILLPGLVHVDEETIEPPPIEGPTKLAPATTDPPPQGPTKVAPGTNKTPPPSSRSLPGIPGPPDNDDATAPPSPKPEAEIARRVWDRLDPKPATPFIGVQKIAGALLRAGHDATDIEEAMVVVPTISLRWVEGQINKNNPNRGRAVTNDRSAATGRIEVL